MKPSALFEALHALISQPVPLHIWGACGVGKSQIANQVARDRNVQFLDVRAVQLDPVYLRGLPQRINETKTIMGRAAPAWESPPPGSSTSRVVVETGSIKSGVSFLALPTFAPTLQAAIFSESNGRSR
jgi:hypothetical protein